jgi:hypothetical protein
VLNHHGEHFRHTPTALWFGFHPAFRWYALLLFAIVPVTFGAVVSPLITLILGLVGAGVWAAVAAGQGRRLGVGVLGAVAAAILIPPLYTPLPAYAGISIGGLWILALALTVRRPYINSANYTLFAAVMALGIVGALLTSPEPWFFSLVALFPVLVGFFALSLNASEWRLVRGGIVCIAAIEGLICAVEAFILHRTLTGSRGGGPHPLLAGTDRAEGTLGHPLVAGMVMLVGLLLVVSSGLRIHWKAPLMVVLGAGIFACGSTSVYIAAMLCLGLHFLNSGNRALRLAKLVAVTALASFLLFGSTVLAPITDDVSGANSTHRLNSIIGLPRLLTNRPIAEAIFGTGWGSEQQNYQAGYLINDDFFAVDNQFTSVMMATGLIGFIMFVAATALALSQSRSSTRLALFSLVFMFFSFDVLGWGATTVLFIVLAVNRSAPRPMPGNAQRAEQRIGTPIGLQ